MFCTNCGQPVSRGQRFCNACGSLQASVNAGFRGAQQATAGAYPVTEAANLPELEGVFGWLRFFCFLITVVAPVGLFIPNRRLPLAITAIHGVLIIFGILVGANLWSVGRNALEMLKVYFFARFLFDAVLVFQRTFSITDARSLGTAMGGFIGLMITVVWFLYFRNSLRVKATYGRNI
jgi:zinc-ribbon domain